MSAGCLSRRRTLQPILTLAAAIVWMLPAFTSGGQIGRAAPVDAAVHEQIDRTGQATFWAIMTDQADLGHADDIEDWAERGHWVFDRLTTVAHNGQEEVLRLIDRHGAAHRSFWIVSAVWVTGDRHLVEELSWHPSVALIAGPMSFTIPEPIPASTESTENGVEWGVEAIGAPVVWSTFGVTGEGIVVANIDTGIQFDHPALALQYRGRLEGGGVDHAYSWFDPTGLCGVPSVVPCDNHGHGTHTMGTMVGDDGGTNRIGVAPGARWIAAKGCEFGTCSDAALLASAQWILAPTDLDGQNPRPEFRPHVVNNSWGGGGGGSWFMGFVDAWIAAGIFPQFSNGNAGPACGTSGSPGDYPQSYSAGAHDAIGEIAGFSSRGPSAFDGEIKPNLSAPGVDVRSSVPTDGYAFSSGTSMASPHMAGTVALMWSAAPDLIGDIGWTRDLLDDTAVDTIDLTCGGDADDNNVFGEGRLDAFAAVDQAPRGPTGWLEGTVSDAQTGAPIEGATVRIVGASTRTTTTGSDGGYGVLVGVGSYDLWVTAFGYVDSAPVQVSVSEQGLVHDVALVTSPRHAVTGSVTDTTGAVVSGATVSILGTPIEPALTGPDGVFGFADVPEGSYQLYAIAGRCTLAGTTQVVVDADVQADFALSVRSDTHGHGCTIESPVFMEGETHVLVGDDTQVELTLPFPFEFYNQWYGTAYASTNGFVHFEPSLQTSFFNVPVPNIYLPDAAVYVLWDNLVFDPVVDPECGLWTAEGTSDEGRQWFLVEWRHAAFFDDPVRRVDAEVLLFEDGEILTQYRDIDPDARERGAGAGLGLEDEEGEVGFQYSHREASIGTPDFAVRYIHLPFGAVTGRVLDANDGLPIEGAGITASDASHNPIRDDRTDDQGAYRLPLPVGSYTVSATADDYVTGTEAVTIQADGHEPDVVLHLATGHPEVTPPAVAFAGDGDATVMLVNTGSAALSWHLFEEVNGRPVDVAWLSVEPSSGGLAAGESVELSLTAVTADMMSGSYVAAAVLTSDAGRLPRLEIPVTLTVGSPGASLAVNCGGGGWVDNDGAVWLADQAHATGSWGYTDHRARTRDTDEDIAGSVDDTVFQSLLRRPGSYRFDGLPAGTYTIELSFAEIEPEVVAGDRIFDVVAGGADLLSSFDIVASVGRLTAHRPEPFTVEVGTGPLEIRFDAARRSLPAVINGIRLVQELE